jgi:di/tricarboxylate transporter
MDLFEIGYVGLPCTIAGSLLLILVGRYLLPNRTDMLEQLGEQRREYLVEMLVQPNCPLIGEDIEQAGLRHLPGLFLIEIDRQGDIITPVTPEDTIHANDRLLFTGVVSTIVDLDKIPGLVPAVDFNYEFHPKRRQRRRLTEVVLSRTSPLIGTTVREANFRERYNAAVVAVHRNGVRLTNKIGSIILEPGDTLLLQTRSEFVSTYRNSRDFYLVSDVEGAEPRRHHKMQLSAILAGVLVLWLVLTPSFKAIPALSGFGSTAIAAITIAGVMILTRCLTVSEARNSLELNVLLTIAGALGLGLALERSGAAKGIAEFLVSMVGERPYLLLIVVYLMALVFTETITNNAVAAMLLPIAIAVAWQGGYNPRPFIIAITLAASLSFITPIGYQTNLMVMGPGGYRPADYLRCGAPLALIVSITALAVIPQIWPF